MGNDGAHQATSGGVMSSERKVGVSHCARAMGGSALPRLVGGRRGWWGLLEGGERSSQIAPESIKLDQPTR